VQPYFEPDDVTDALSISQRERHAFPVFHRELDWNS
jgi:hypothetical protein